MIEARINNKVHKSSSILDGALKFVRFGINKGRKVEFKPDYLIFFSAKFPGNVITMSSEDFIELMEQQVEKQIKKD